VSTPTEEELQEAFRAACRSLSLATLAMNLPVTTSDMVEIQLGTLHRKLTTLLAMTRAAPTMVFERTELEDWVVSLLSPPAPDDLAGL